jgi:hypothetical protein
MVMGIGRQHEGKLSMKVWEQIELLKREEDLVREWIQDHRLNEGESFAIIPDRMACRSQNENARAAELS